MGMKHSIGVIYKDGRKTKCQWKKCKPNSHPYPISYPGKSSGVTHRATFKGTWDKENTGLYPRVKLVRKAPIPFPLPGKPKFKLTRYNFWFQRHHVIPCRVMKEMPNLKHNLKLMGWNMNDYESNGICLPFDLPAVKFYDLQAHRGSHPTYSDRVKKVVLKDLEKKCADFCQDGKQDELLTKIAKKVDYLRDKIIDWDKKFLIHTISEAYR